MTYDDLKNIVVKIITEKISDNTSISALYDTYMLSIGMPSNTTNVSFRNMIAYLSNVINFLSKNISFNIVTNIGND